MNRLRAKATYANVMATIAVFVALGGVSYAAATLPRNSVGPKQIRKGAVTPAKLSRGAKAALTGHQGEIGPLGPKGERGEKGDPGPRGPSAAVAGSTLGPVAWATTPTRIESVNLGAGSWVVTATGLAVNHENTAEAAECRLLVGATPVDASGELFLAAFPQPGSKQPIALTAGATVSGDTAAELQCEAIFADGQVVNPSITAIQVADLKTE